MSSAPNRVPQPTTDPEMDTAVKQLVSVIVPCRNEANYIGPCLDSILQNDYGPDRLEILVVDGQSTDGTLQILDRYARSWSQIRVLANPGRIAPTALNIGILHSTGAVVMRIDAHCRYPEGYISSLVKWLARSGADNVGGLWRILPGSNTGMARAIAIALSHRFGAGDSHFRVGTSVPKWVDTVPFGCYRRNVFDRIGLFDEELVRNQDDEFNQRLLKNGGRILLVPDVTIDYYARDTLSKVVRMHYQYGLFKPLAAKKVGRVGTIRQLIPSAFVVSLALSLVLGLVSAPARIAFIVILGTYSLALTASVLDVVLNAPFRVALRLFVVFPAIHFSYAFGWIHGAARLVARKNPVGGKTSEVPISR